jgi:hypothetical protein
MFRVHRSATAVALALVLPLAACDKPTPPPPPKAQATAPAPAPPPVPSPQQELQRLAGEVYVFAYPLVLMDVTRQVATAKTPLNTLAHRRTFPDASSKDAPRPNADVLYSSAWLDLSQGPVILSVPDTRGRYYVIPMLDAWTNVFSSPGKRQTGTEKADFAIVGPKWKGTLPDGVAEIRAPTSMVWLLGRIDATKGDLATVAKLQDQFKLTPLAQWGKRPGKGIPAAAPAPPSGVDVKTPPVEQVERMDASTFLTRFASLLPANPPSADDAPMNAKLEKLGVVPGQPFDTAKLEPASAAAIDEGFKAARAALLTASRGSLGDLRNGWAIHWDLGRYGTNYGYRALMAMLNLGANAPEDALFASTRFDARGKPLTGANRYVLRFDKGKTPPAEAFWSLSLYDAKGSFVPNPIARHAIGDRDDLKTNPDGSIDLHVQHENPGKDKEANWLPAPKDEFSVMLRIYWPKEEMLQRRWTFPGLAPVK